MKSPSSACLRYHTSENTCDQTGMLDVPYGQGKSLMHGAVYKYVYTINRVIQFLHRDTLIFTMFKEGAYHLLLAL